MMALADADPPETSDLPDHPYPGTPTWVKAFAVAVAAIVILVVVVLVLGTALGLHSPMPGGHGG